MNKKSEPSMCRVIISVINIIFVASCKVGLSQSPVEEAVGAGIYDWVKVDSVAMIGLTDGGVCGLPEDSMYAVIEYPGEGSGWASARVYVKGGVMKEFELRGLYGFVSCGRLSSGPSVFVSYDAPVRGRIERYVSLLVWNGYSIEDSTFRVPNHVMAYVIENGKVYVIDSIPGYVTVNRPEGMQDAYQDVSQQGAPGGRYVLFLSDADSAYVYDLRTRTVRASRAHIPKASGSYDLSDDGRVILWGGGGFPPTDSRLVDLETGNVVHLPRSIPGSVAFYKDAYWFTRWDMEQNWWVLSRYRDGKVDLVLTTPQSAGLAYVRSIGDHLMAVETALDADSVQRSWIKVYR